MNEQPDNFFREKLKGYHKRAPVGAWDRIESRLEKPKRTFGWWKIAASLLLLTVIGYLLWLQTSPSNKQQPIAQSGSEIQAAVQPGDRTKIEPSRESQNLEKDHKSSNAINSSEKKVIPKKIKHHQRNIAQKSTKVIPPSLEETKQVVEITSAETDIAVAEPKIEPKQKSSTITLIFTAEETNKYLDKNALAQATSEEKKSSTFKKLLKKASDLKNNQDPFGDLREKKNEILALNFKNEKRGQNK